MEPKTSPCHESAQQCCFSKPNPLKLETSIEGFRQQIHQQIQGLNGFWWGKLNKMFNLSDTRIPYVFFGGEGSLFFPIMLNFGGVYVYICKKKYIYIYLQYTYVCKKVAPNHLPQMEQMPPKKKNNSTDLSLLNRISASKVNCQPLSANTLQGKPTARPWTSMLGEWNVLNFWQCIMYTCMNAYIYIYI